MCIPSKCMPRKPDRPYLDINSDPNIPDSPESPPPSPLTHEHRYPVARLSSSTSEFSSSVDSEDGEDDQDDDALLKASKYVSCEVFHSTKRRVVIRYHYHDNNSTMAVRAFIVLAVLVLMTKVIADVTFGIGVAGLEIGRDNSDEKCLVKRQLPPIEQGNVVIDNIFQIPIKTLDAVGTLIKNVRPLVRRTRQRIQQYYSNGQQQNSNGQQQYSNGQQNYNYYGQQQSSNGLQSYNYYSQQYNRLGRQSRQVQVEDQPKRTKPSIVVLQSSIN
ncbi:uncharacterized protein LOC114119181 [Aphis gossypii]|uniref:uncharacterized protein LOC114119181 n=1 Tax=Aphis gossypii TaxID=80765 RepID=UPI002158DBAC|nr:uncharacterized protein LOC114119181 [Aphis gossypii]